MKKQKLRTLTGFLLTGICLFCGNSVIAKSVTLTGSTGTNTTYIVVPPEYEGKEGEFVATATSTNKNTTSYGEPYISNYVTYVEVTETTYGNVVIQLSFPAGGSTSSSKYNIASLTKGSYTVRLSQQKKVTQLRYSLHMNYWSTTDSRQDLLYYAQNGTYPAQSGVTVKPEITKESDSETITSGLSVASAYIVVYGVEDDTVTTTPNTGGSSESGENNITVNVTTPGTDEGVYSLITSLFGYVSEIQNILSASDDAIRDELARYITELRNDYQQADAQMAVTIQNQITALDSALSTDIASLRSSLEMELASLRNQISGLQTQQNSLLEEFYSLKTELQKAIQENSSDIGKLSEELKAKYDALVNANTTLREDLLKEIAKLANDYKEADEALIADYSSKLSALQTLLQQADSNLSSNINSLQTAYQNSDLKLKENLELQLSNLRSQLNESDQQLLQEIAVLENAMYNADEALQADYSNKIAALEQGLSNEGAALRAEINNLQKNYQIANTQLKENL